MFIVSRSPKNPILNPNSKDSWDSFASFNWCPVQDGKNIRFVYRGMPKGENIEGNDIRFSMVGAGSYSAGSVKERHFLFKPEYDWEKFGVEDPRVVKLDGTFYISYTAIGGNPANASNIKAALALSDDLKTIKAKYLVTPFNAKAMAFFPDRINGKIAAVLTAHTDEPPSKMAVVLFDSEKDISSPEFWNKWHEKIGEFEINPRRRADDHIEVGAPPLLTPYGWLLIYSHIQHYNSPKPVFGIEAVLLDKNDPLKILGKTKGPIFVPEEVYENFGQVSSVVFPSGAILSGDTVSIWYGAADTTGCIANVNLHDLVDSMKGVCGKECFNRFRDNPILSPVKDHAWENQAVFNPSAIRIKNKTHILYRAMGKDNTSVVGYASSLDGLHIDDRLENPIYTPRDTFETKSRPGNSGCEDPRLTQIGDTIYMLYTAYNGDVPPSVALTSITVEDFVNKNWSWAEPMLLTHPGLDDKDAGLLPKKIKGRYLVFHRIQGHICLNTLKSFQKETPLEEATPLFGPRVGMWDSLRIGIAAPPIETKEGWLLLYHGIDDAGVYRVGAALLDLEDPWKIIARSADYIFEPVMDYEKKGIVSNVVFPCGATLQDKKLYIYYGGGDMVTGVAEANIQAIIESLIR